MWTTINPVRFTHIKYVVQYLRELMKATLTPLEDQMVMLHCGMYTGRPVSLACIAEVYRMQSEEEAELLYRQAVAKTRHAIPGSKLENWIVCYHHAYYPDKKRWHCFCEGKPIPVWKSTKEQNVSEVLAELQEGSGA